MGRHFELLGTHGLQNPYQVVGLAEDAAYKDVHDPMLPVMYVPMLPMSIRNGRAAVPQRVMFFVKTANADPAVMAQTLRQEIQRISTGVSA